MTEEQIAARKIFAGEKKASMKRRDDHHDYSERRMYMITLETAGRRPIFGRLVGTAFAPAGSADEPRIELSALGKAVEREWMGISNYYPQIEVKAVQMMPDHMHGILFVKSRLPVHLGQVISGFKAGCRKAQRALLEAAFQGAAAEPQPTEKPQPAEKGEGLGAAAFKGAAAEPQPTEKPQPAEKPQQSVAQGAAPLFAKGYNDLILRSYDELSVWQNYLRDNPRRLMIKRARPSFLRPFFGLRIGPYTLNGIGNRSLLSAPKLLPVLLSRRLSDQELEGRVSIFLAESKAGAVLVSPSISPGEKRVMRAAFDAGFPTVIIMPNGFSQMTKPHGEQFYACASGHLLMLSAWGHSNERINLSADMCHQMNLIAIEICKHTKV